MAVTLTGYGGVGEIGGNAFLLDDGRSRVFLDFGKRFGNDPHFDELRGRDTTHMRPAWGDYFDEYLKPRTFRMAHDLAALQLIPDVMGAYRNDIGGTDGPAGVDGVLLSHAHADHAGLIGLLKPEVPVFCSAESKATLGSLQTTGVGGVEQEFVQARSKGLGYTQKGAITPMPKREAVARNYVEELSWDVGDWDITQFAVDHSIHGARGSILAGRDVTVAYTGDFRLHGRQADDTKRFLARAAGADVLVTEGTNVSQGHKHEGTDHELEVEAEIEQAIARHAPGFVGISHPPRDLDRFVSIWQVCRRIGRRLVISTKQAHLLESLRAAGRDDLPDPRTEPSLAVHLRAKKKGTLLEPEGRLTTFDDAGRPSRVDVGVEEWSTVLSKDYEGWEQPYLECDNTVSSAAIGADPASYVLSINYWTITDLFDVFPDRSRAGGLYIHSQTQPFNDEMEISDRKLRRWLDAFHLTRVDTHVSGHLSEEDLHWAIDEVGARRLVPIHSLHPSLTAEKYETRSGHKAILPPWGKPVPLS